LNAYINYEQNRIDFTVPDGWRIISGEDKPPVSGIADPLAEVRRALDHPIGSPGIEHLTRPGMEVVLLFDDLQRPTPADLVLPEIMDRLNRSGVPDERIKAVCGLGTHPLYTLEQLRLKIGDTSFGRLEGRLFCHDSHASDNVIIGRTNRGTLVEINHHVASADLAIGVGECMPHPVAGYGGGFKLLMPGVSSYRSVADHHYTWMRHRNSRVNLLEGNLWWEEIVDAGRLSPMKFKVDMIINEKQQVVRAFAGDPVEEQKEAARYAKSLYLVPLPRLADVTITSAYPLEVGVQATKALTMANFCTRTGGTIIWVAPQKEAGAIMPLIREMGGPDSAGDYHRRLIDGKVPEDLNAFGISYIMQIVYFKELSEKFNVVHVTEGLSEDQVRMMRYTYAAGVQEAVDRVARNMPEAQVAVFPSGGTIIPEIL